MEEKKSYCLRCNYQEGENTGTSLITCTNTASSPEEEIFCVCTRCVRYFIDKLTELYPVNAK